MINMIVALTEISTLSSIGPNLYRSTNDTNNAAMIPYQGIEAVAILAKKYVNDTLISTKL